MTMSMDANTFALYTHELRNQCMYAEAALNLFNQALEKESKTGAFFAAQNFLTSVSQISRLLWPNRVKAKRRGEFLRQALGIPAEYPLNDDRLRNLWDLADEKTDDWITASKNQVIAVDFIGPIEALGDKRPKDEHIYRLYEPTTHRLYFRGEVFNLQQIASRVAEIAARVNQAHDQLFPKKQPDAQPAQQAQPVANDSSAGGETPAEQVPTEQALAPEDTKSETAPA